MTPTDLYDALTLDIERAEVLAAHLAEKLSHLSNIECYGRELYALALIAESMNEKHTRIRATARALLASGGAR